MFGWRVLFLIGAIPVILIFFVRRHVKEDRSYVNKKHNSNAKLIKFVIKEMFSTPKLAYRTIALIIMMTVQIGGYFGIMNWLPTLIQMQLDINIANSSY